VATSERIVSPGVFTNEKDLYFLQTGVGGIGAALIGPTIKGPAFVPVAVSSYSDFVAQFGSLYEHSYLPYTAKSYLNNAGGATIVRVLGSGGYALTHPLALVATGSYGKKLISLLHPTFVIGNDDDESMFAKSTLTSNNSGSFVLIVSGGMESDTTSFTSAVDQKGTPFSASIDPENSSFIGNLYGFNPYGTNAVYNYVCFTKEASASLAADPATKLILESGSLSSPQWDFTTDYLASQTPWVTSQKVGANTVDLFRFETISHGVHSNYEIKVGISNNHATPNRIRTHQINGWIHYKSFNFESGQIAEDLENCCTKWNENFRLKIL
jgi:hypothetical protein